MLSLSVIVDGDWERGSEKTLDDDDDFDLEEEEEEEEEEELEWERKPDFKILNRKNEGLLNQIAARCLLTRKEGKIEDGCCCCMRSLEVWE